MKLLSQSILFLIQVILINCGDGPVYVDPNAVVAVKLTPSVVTNDVKQVTQTVYGFLDFTTTIGNTIMVFSPQSSPAAVPEPKVEEIPSTPPPIVNVIETKPAVEVREEVKEIKPSKTLSKHTEKKQNIISSVVQVMVEPAKPVIVKPVIVEPVTPKIHIISSQVQVISEDTPLSSESTPNIVIAKEAEPEKKPIVYSSHVEAIQGPVSTVTRVEEAEKVYSSVVEIHSSSDDDIPVLQIENNIGEPEYDFLSRQPSEFAEETFRVVNLKPGKSRVQKPKQSEQTTAPAQKRNDSGHPTGLVTKLGGTVVKDGVTTIHETSVIGTYISGKYAQVLQSTSHISTGSKPKPTSSSSLRILKTAAPSIPKTPKYNLDASPSDEETNLPVDNVYGQQPSLVRSTRRPASPGSSFKNRLKVNKQREELDSVEEPAPKQPFTPSSSKKSTRNRIKPKNTRFNRFSTSSVELATVSVFSEPATQASYSSRRNKNTKHSNFKVATTTTAQAPTANNDNNSRKFKPKVQPSPVDGDSASTSLYKFKLNRAPGRWQYKSSPKPKVTIRGQNKVSKDTTLGGLGATEPSVNGNEIAQSRADSDVDLEGSSSLQGDVLDEDVDSNNGLERKLPIETIKVEISTPADFSDTYFEIATIKSPYTFQAGTIKHTRYITVTSTFEKTLDPEPTISSTLTEPLTENILATTSHIDKEHNLLDSSLATLPPISLASDAGTPPLETLTETFSTTQDLLKTHILPVIYGGVNTTSYTLIQTYHITRLVTATKTLPPMEAYQFVPSKTLKEFNSRLDEAGSELHLELEFGDDDENDPDDEDNFRRELPPDLDLSNIGSDFDISEVDKTNIPINIRPKKKINSHKAPNQIQQDQTPNLSNEQLQQLAFLKLINPNAQLPSFLPTSKPVIKWETLYDTHVLPIVNGQQTSFSTISRPIATVSRTEYELATSLPQQQIINPYLQQQQLQQQQLQQQQLQQQQLQQHPQLQQQQFQITSTPLVQQTMVTQTSSKILKLTFGAKTAYTTLFSTKVVPTLYTTFVTQSIPLQTNGFPGYFPAPFPPYPYGG